jgi:hypothetical protein
LGREITQVRFIPAQAINVDIEITDQTADVDANGRSAPGQGHGARLGHRQRR